MSDIAFDRELQALLGTAPSPEFVARVRTRIAEEPRRFRFGSGSWRFAASALAVAALLTMTVRVVRLGHVDRTAPTLNARRLPIGEASTPAPQFRGDIDTPIASSTSTSIARRRNPSKATNQGLSTSAAATPTAAAEPEVLVDRREAAALRAFFARARSGEIALTAIVAPDTTPPADSNDLHDIYIAPIAFAPVFGATEDKGVRQ